MPFQLPADCLNEIFEYLEKDKASLYSCLLVNRLWCEISVRILWRDIWTTKPVTHGRRRLKVNPTILNTFITCLPNNSKTHLLKKGILNSTQISKTPLFDYASFCKVLSINEVGQTIIDIFKNQKYLAKEIMKMFMAKTSLKKLSYYSDPNTINLSFLRYPGAKDYLTKLSKLSCSSSIKSKFFYKLSQISCNIQSLSIEFKDIISDDLKILISSQNNLKYLSLIQYNNTDWRDIIPSLVKHSNTLIKLKLFLRKFCRIGQLSFITKLTNLQELVLLFRYNYHFDEINSKLQYITFPHLQVLKFPCAYPDHDMLIKFLENNGKNLKEFYIFSSDDSLNLAIAKFCPNLISLYTLFRNDKIETFKVILNSCQQLESFETHCNYELLSEKELLGALAKYSPKNFYRLKLSLANYLLDSRLVSEDLEDFPTNWKNRVPQKSFSFIIRGCTRSSETKEKYMSMVEKYKKLGINIRFDFSCYN
ncbi:uncharacterized protein OCT59_005063 [Rhizophagus irregularis]|uniref:F-box domain-containing protein n=1 Tax=Rhizophagus irregularis (strain DAOM 197198w) TaxID=1432141 RepID=A0A015N6N1_RHIIW|nr:hypothetical protein RirG_047330 [Rhizophagus irregularis DAOM 197198w]UZO13566.1 hypothetical protein OCT59_005063 [Rhizophagus irregularis]GBC21421.1 hypothetical protein GLOIN_2v1784405 [Rhizophagus irregularis DAOM 181602=DAOM 197198]